MSASGVGLSEVLYVSRDSYVSVTGAEAEVVA